MIRIAHNNVTAQLVDADRETKLEVHRLLSYRVEGAEHSGAFASGHWDGRSSLFNFDKGTFPRGFVGLVSQGLKKRGHDIQVVAKPLPEPLGPEKPVVDAFGESERYDYQPAAVEKLVRHGAVIIQVATGGGKSRIARLAYKRIDRPTLFLTTRGILMHQMRRAVEKMDGTKVAVLGDGEWGIEYRKSDGTKGRRLSKFCVGMVQTLAQRLSTMDAETELEALRVRRLTALSKKQAALAAQLKKAGKPLEEIQRASRALGKQIEATYPTPEQDVLDINEKVRQHIAMREHTIELLGKFEFVIAEEAHEVSGNSFYDVMNACRGAAYRMALTATPFMKDNEEANMKLMATCGQIALRISEQLLIERGILARPYFKFLKVPAEHRPKKLFRSTPWQRAYEVGIVHNEYRNKLFCAEALRGLRYGLNSMMLVQRKEHGNVLKAMLERGGARVMFIQGADDQDERDRALTALGNGDTDVVIGTNILDVGVDVPSVGMIHLVGGGKAEVANRQRIGRGLREKKNGLPNVALIVDCEDDFNNHLREHAIARRRIVESTPGFAEGIAANDFDYAELGLVRKAA